ncbi:chromo-domain-containing protein [Paxillus ammoniavirescens]|nr:chromo-domain-containing protein [Paxillus ammoniavirescens]
MVNNLKRAAPIDGQDAKCSKRSKIHVDDASPPPWTVTVRETMVFEPTPSFDTFWRLAAERHDIDVKRRSGLPPPWTTDPILQSHKFCNTFRVLDRVSQFLVAEVIEKGPQKLEEVTFRVLLFSTYTSIRTYETLRKNIQPFTWGAYNRATYEKVLRQLYDNGISIYTGAYQKPAPELGFAENFMNHLALLEVLMRELPAQLKQAKYLADVFGYLRTFKSMGDFTAYQLVLNLSYSNVMNFSEYDFVVIGIGSRRGLQRCFREHIPRSAEVDLVRWMQVTQEQHFERLGITFNGLGPDRLPMTLCDIEHTLCELDKYVRRCSQKAKPRPFEPSGKLGKIRLPKAWSHKSRRVLRIKCPEEAEAEVLEKFIVESIEAHREVHGVREFLVLWEGYPEDEATWEPEDGLMEDAPSVVNAYLDGIRDKK